MSRLYPIVMLLVGCGQAQPEQRESPSGDRRGPPPPTVESASANACKTPGKIKDADFAAFVPEVSGSFCIDAKLGATAYGQNADKTLEEICELYDGECAVYQAHTVVRVLEVAYVTGGSKATINLKVSKFKSPENAYGMFTKRLIGDGDPIDEATPKAIRAGFENGVLGIGNGYLWRGDVLVEATYNDESKTPTQLDEESKPVVGALLTAVNDKLTGDTSPALAKRIPEKERLPLGVRYVVSSALVKEGGAGLYGYYKTADAKRYRVALVPHADEAKAQALVALLEKTYGAKTAGEGTVTMRVEEMDWIIRRVGTDVFAVGDESRVLRKGMPDEERAKLYLSSAEKSTRLDEIAPPAKK